MTSVFTFSVVQTNQARENDRHKDKRTDAYTNYPQVAIETYMASSSVGSNKVLGENEGKIESTSHKFLPGSYAPPVLIP